MRRPVLSISTALLALLLASCAGVPAAAPAPGSPAAGDSTMWEADIAAFERADRSIRHAPGAVVFVGSSSIRMWDTLAADFPGVPIINRGFGGSRVRDSTWYADRIVTRYRPGAVAFYAGDNDLVEGRSPHQVRDDFVAFVAEVRRSVPDARIGFIAIKPSPSRQALLPQMRQANRLVRAYAQATPGVDYLDVFTPMLDADGQPRRELFLADMLHMNRLGYEIWIDVVGPWLRALPRTMGHRPRRAARDPAPAARLPTTPSFGAR